MACHGRLVSAVRGMSTHMRRSSIRRENLQQANTTTPDRYSWDSEETALISAILGAAEERGVEREPTNDQKPRQGSIVPKPRQEAVQTDMGYLRSRVDSLTEEVRAYRGEMEELHVLIEQTHTSSPLSLPRRLWRGWRRPRR